MLQETNLVRYPLLFTASSFGFLTAKFMISSINKFLCTVIRKTSDTAPTVFVLLRS